MKRLTPVLLLAALTGLLAAPTLAQGEAVVAPTVPFLERVRHDPPAWLAPGLVDAEGFAGTIRFARPLTASELAAVEAAGVRFWRRPWVAGAPSGNGCLDPSAPAGIVPDAQAVGHIGGVYPARIAFAALPGLRQHPLVVQVESEYLLEPHQPLNVTAPQTGAPEFTQAMALAGIEHPGKGVRIADIDSGIDVFHPSFFHADGGYYAWVDVNGDGQLTFGVDGVDMDGSGTVMASEVLRYHDVSLVNLYEFNGDLDALEGDGQFEADLDWVFVDSNGNGKRDFGRDAGFDDSTPAFGEPVFVLDDVNGDGALSPDEKLVRLKTSKIRKALVQGTEYVAGENLTEVTSDLFPKDYSGIPRSMHGTGVAGILAANTPGKNRYVGLAPYADLYMIDSSKDQNYQPGGVDGTVPKLVWARDQQVDIVLFEFSSWGMTFMDGTSNLESAIDELYTKNGILQVVPAGNLADSGKHFQADLSAGTAEVAMQIPEEMDGYAFETPAVIFSLYWQGASNAFAVEVQAPGGVWVPLAVNAYDPVPLGNQSKAVSYTAQSQAGITHRMIYIMDDAQKAVPQGDWNWRFTNQAGGTITLHGYVNDLISSWGRAVGFDHWESPQTTICHPSTADSALSVAAFAGRFGPDDELGRVRDYSSRGPRMDGFQAIDVAAPDDPYTPLCRFKTGMMMGLLDIQASYTVFGGTSGAGPHVTAALALLMQHDSSLTASELFAAIVDSADQADFMGGLPNSDYGHGKLNVYRAGLGAEIPANEPPEAALALFFRNGFEATLDASGSTDAEAGPLEYRWDLEYDGDWDTPWSSNPQVLFTYPAVAGNVTAKVAVRDEHGAGDEALLTFEVLDDYDPDKQPPEPPAAEPGPEAADDDIVSPPDTPLWQPDLGAGPGPKKSTSSGGCTAAGPAPAAPLLLLLLLAVAALTRRRRAHMGR